MKFDEQLRDAQARFPRPTFYERFERAALLLLTAPVVAAVASVTRQLVLAVIALVPENPVDPAHRQVFQAVFGMIFTAVSALGFKHSLLVVLERRGSVARVRSVVPIAPLALARGASSSPWT